MSIYKKHDGTYYEYWDNGMIKVVGNYERGNKSDTWYYFNREGEIIKEEGYMILDGESSSFMYYEKNNSTQ